MDKMIIKVQSVEKKIYLSPGESITINFLMFMGAWGYTMMAPLPGDFYLRGIVIGLQVSYN